MGTASAGVGVRRAAAVATSGALAVASLVAAAPSAAAAATGVAAATRIVAPLPAAQVFTQQVSSDPYTASGPQHATEVEPHLAAHGDTVVAAFQVARFNSGGSALNMGWATSTDGGATWTSGLLPGVTTAAGGAWPRTVDQNVAYDAAHGTWLIQTLGVGLVGSSYVEQQLDVSRSSDGLSWSSPVSVVSTDEPDKSWLACDNVSPRAGRCYVLWSSQSLSDRFFESYTTDGGLTWSTPVSTPANTTGYNVQPVVQPDGTLVVVATNLAESQVIAFRSTDGGVTLTNPVVVSGISRHTPSQVRFHPKPSVDVAPDGRVFAVWADCRFRPSCSANDLVLSTSLDGIAWSPVTRIGPDDVSGTEDHMLPGLGVDPASSGGDTHLGLVYHYLPVAACGGTGQPACQLDVGYVESHDAGQTWSSPTLLSVAAEPTSWLPVSSGGHMVGDYFGTTFVGGNAVTAFPYATAPTGSTFHQAMQAAVVGGDTVGVSDAAVREPGPGGTAYASFVVQLGAAQPGDVTVGYATADGTATAGSGDYTAVSGTVTIPAGERAVAVDVPVKADGLYEGPETFGLRLSNPVGAALARGRATATVTDLDIAPSVYVSDAYVMRGGDPSAGPAASFTLSLNKPSALTTQVNVATANSTAVAGTDYTALPATTVTFAPGQTSKVVSVPTFGTSSASVTTSFKLSLSSAVNATVGDSTGYGYLVAPQGPPQLRALDASVVEGNSGTSTLSFPVVLSAPASTAVTVKYATTAKTATAGTDYTSVSGTLTIPAGVTRATVGVPVVGDTTAEPNETLGLSLSSPSKAVLASTSATGTIVNDDGTPGTTPPPSAYVSDSYVVRGTDPTTGPTAVFSVTLNRAAASTVSVKVATANSSAVAGTDYTALPATTLTFAPGQTSATVSVPTFGVSGPRPTVSFKVALSGPVGLTVGDSTGYGYLVADAGPPQVSVRDASVVEGDSGTTSLGFPVVLATPTGVSVTVTYMTTVKTATAGTDYTAVSGTVTIPAGSTGVIVSVPVTGDTAVEPNETVGLSLSSPKNSTATTTTATGTIIDDD